MRFWLSLSLNLILAAVTAIMLAPLVIPLFGAGAEEGLATSYGVICGPDFSGGIASIIGKVLSFTPLIGGFIAKGGIFSSILAACLILSARFVFYRYNKAFFAYLLAGIGFVIALPGLLPAFGHGLSFIALAVDDISTARDISRFIGYSGYQHATVLVFAGTFIAAHVNCIISGTLIVLSCFQYSFAAKKLA